VSEYVAADLVVKLRTDSAQFEQAMQAVRQRLADLGRGVQQIGQVQTQAQQNMQQMTQAVQRQTEAVRASSSAWQTMLTVAGGVGLATGLGALVSQMTQFARSTVDVGTRMEMLRASFGALANSSSAGAQQFQQLFETAQRLGVAFEPLARGWRTLTAAASQTSLSIADQQRLLNALATEARRVGASNQELERAILAVGQMASKGKVSMEELRQQLGEALPTAMAAAAQGMGRTTEELTKLVETGRVSFTPFAQALTRGFEQMQQKSGDFATGARQTFNQLGNAMLGLKDTIATNVLPELERIARVTRGILESATSILRQTGQGGARPEGPGITALGGTEAQQREAERLSGLIGRMESQLQAPQSDLMRKTREEQLARAREQRDELLHIMRLTQDQAAAQRQVTQEANKTADALARQKDFNEAFAKTTAQIQKDTAAFREQAALAPGRLGRPTGTKEDVETFNKGLQDIVGKHVEALATLVQQRGQDVQLTDEQRQALRALDQQYNQFGRSIEAVREAETRRRQATQEAEQAAKRAAREAIQDQETYQAAIDNVRMAIVRQQDEAFTGLQRLASRFTQAPEERAIDQAQAFATTLVGTERETEAQQYLKVITDVATIEGQIVELRRQAALSAPAGERAIAGARFSETIAAQLERLRTPQEERLAAQLRRQAERQGFTLSGQDEAVLKQITAQERLNTIMVTAQRIGDSAAQTITNGLMNIVGATQNVSEAWRAMAKSILDSVAQIALNEGFRTLIRLGLGLVAGAVGSSATGALAGNTTLNSPTYINALVGGAKAGAQGIGPIHHPTMILAGENPSTTPEYLLNRSQMQSLLGAGPSAGGQAAGGISIINVASKQEGESLAARERAMGKQVIVNYILEELSAGSGSRISQAMRSTMG
jgi:tape measure domain-containing protein